MDKEKLKLVLRELREKYREVWKSVELEVLKILEDVREMVTQHIRDNREFDFKTTEEIYYKIRSINDKIGQIIGDRRFCLFWISPSPSGGFGSAEEDIKNIRNLILNNDITRKMLIVTISRQTMDDELKSRIKEVLKSANGVKIGNISSWLSILNPQSFFPVSGYTVNKEFRKDFGIRPFWGQTYSSESQLDQAMNKFIEFTNTIKKVANELGIDNMIEVVFYLSKYRSVEINNSNNGIPPKLEKKLNTLLSQKKQVILYGPPGTGKTWLARKYVMKKTNGNREFYEFVTFHPSYSYEEFVEGIRPKVRNGQIVYEVEDGIFKTIVIKAICEALRSAEGELASVAGEVLELLNGIERGLVDTYGNYVDVKRQLLKMISNMDRSELRRLFENAPKFYLVIDEINRGDISRIFGELITLLEADKRLGEENQIIVTLPYSKEPFGVPPNLFIIGTMNTADRSIALIDVALRRRFGFIEIMPSYKVLINELGIDNVNDEKDAIEKIKSWNLENLDNPEDIKKLAVKVLYAINEKIKKLYDRDHQIGHSYLLRLKNCETREKAIETLKFIWFHEIIPLLQEYFYDSPDKLKEIVGEFIETEDEGGRIETYDFKRMEDFDNEQFLKALKRIAQGGERSG